ncbi:MULTISPECIES: DUF4178 domain-containing protein [unclassified Corynebacterium]|uniref:DUF4178 domain-containing protein n=1 Tax=unclassified Corynebacterium TaxID=2624378 RepID=UPI0029C9CEF2|nr:MULTISPECIES: DUF4178 domain-containing protein [unclassified Corynebacterium]WPF65377.1 DUF4178 domain-containing protein [Corynebacterium sp. 22KM0430]WPF67872.1 DUF4178 domain-containing protein [Corynebacterium sp. 21KM1197]
MEIPLIIIVVLVIAAVVLAYQGWKKSQEQVARTQPRQDPFAHMAREDEQKFGPENLGPGAIVARGGVDYVVRGTITVRQGYYTWHEHLLDGGRGGEWLSTEVDEGQLKLSWWRTREDFALSPGKNQSVEGVEYAYQESGMAQFSSEGNTGLPATGEVEFYDYADRSGAKLLGLEKFGSGAWEASVGETIAPGEVTVYPAPRE